MDNWCQLFRCSPANPPRDKFVARVLGVFSEEIVRCWCSAKRSPFADLGRPRVLAPRASKACTLDFTLQSKADGQIYVAEMKCWVEYQSYRHLTLKSPEQLKAMDGPAFQAFLSAARQPARCGVVVNGQPQEIDGAVLIWSDVSKEGRTTVMQATGLHSVLSLRDIVDDLVAWKDARYHAFLEERLGWCEQLFTGLRQQPL